MFSRAIVPIVLPALVLLAGCSDPLPPASSTDSKDRTMNAAASAPKHTNRLAGSTSPYLLQHADNPVHWYPWGDEAFERAKREDKPVFLSIGYSACHWCHVMERESFENEAIATVMNEHFVCIKVDREERPDVDEIYMNAVQLMTRSGGWPLSVFLTPDRKPYFGGTYFPPEGRMGMPGFKSVLEHAARVYRERPDAVADATGQITAALKRLAAGSGASGELDADLMPAAVRAHAAQFDPDWGGFGRAPKFPPTGAVALLLRHHHNTGDTDALRMATVTLDKMAGGGMLDHLGGGFHRYAVDREWLVPHFEKMLYDNALLAVVYLDAYRVTARPLYARVARETLDYVLRAMTDERGGFHSAQDADSEGVEGKYYVWDKAEIERARGDDADLFNAYYGVTERGNFEGKNILHARVGLAPFAKERGLEPTDFERRLAAMKATLLAVRDRRVPPGKDDKVLASWNGLMVSAMARGHVVLGDAKYRAAAERAATFVLTEMRDGDGTLLHTYRDGRAHVPAFLDDYAFLLAAAVDLYEATFEPAWIERAEELAAEMHERLWDAEGGGYYSTADDRDDLLVRGKDAHDGALPAGNAIATHALLRLAKFTDDDAHRTRATKTLEAFAGAAERAPQAFTRLIAALDFARATGREIVIAGKQDDEVAADLVAAVRKRYLPNTVVARARPDDAEAAKRIPLLEGRTPVDGRPAAYVCENYACKQPVTTVAELEKLLVETGRRSE
jgi:hypothetical protein